MQNITQTSFPSREASSEGIDRLLSNIARRIQQKGDLSYVSVQQQLVILQQLAEFDLGRFLLQHRRMNGYWNNYVFTHPWAARESAKDKNGNPLSDLERFILDRAPIVLATQQRFEIFLHENQKEVENGAQLASVPSGLMGELFYLDYAGIELIELVGIDVDRDSINNAIDLAREQGLSNCIEMIQSDAWGLDGRHRFNLISSNGLTTYEVDGNRIANLYHRFYRALKPGGKLVTSFLTPPPPLTDRCEWNMSKINADDLLLQRIILNDIVQAKFQCYRSSTWTYTQLVAAGFNNIRFIYDEARMFPTVTAYK